MMDSTTVPINITNPPCTKRIRDLPVVENDDALSNSNLVHSNVVSRKTRLDITGLIRRNEFRISTFHKSTQTSTTSPLSWHSRHLYLRMRFFYQRNAPSNHSGKGRLNGRGQRQPGINLTNDQLDWNDDTIPLINASTASSKRSSKKKYMSRRRSRVGINHTTDSTCMSTSASTIYDFCDSNFPVPDTISDWFIQSKYDDAGDVKEESNDDDDNGSVSLVGLQYLTDGDKSKYDKNNSWENDNIDVPPTIDILSSELVGTNLTTTNHIEKIIDDDTTTGSTSASSVSAEIPIDSNQY